VIKGVGIDFIRVERVNQAYRRRPERFLQRIFTIKEREAILKKANPASFIAARFAAKEAVAKALGSGIGPVRWREMEILSGERGKPVVHLTGKAQRWAEKHGIAGVEVTISHDGPYAVAAAIAYGYEATRVGLTEDDIFD
jgi:phosphopantetheine--protein transferase-like protein